MRTTSIVLIFVIILSVTNAQTRSSTIGSRCQYRCPHNYVCRVYPIQCRKPPCPRKPTCIYPRRKPGLCPLVIVPFPGMFSPQCYYDYDCPDTMKCCSHPKSRCLRPYRTSGQCPRFPQTTTCGRRCVDDFDCVRGQRCCHFQECRGKFCSRPEQMDWYDMKNYISHFFAPTGEQET